jgi:hypothetical protein
MDSILIWTVPQGTDSDAFGVYLSYSTDSGEVGPLYASFFRVVSASTLTTYQISTSVYQQLPVFRLDGGMSAEYLVEKSLEDLQAADAQSWNVSQPGGGPNPVYATPEFLQLAVQQTVNIYDQQFGDASAINTVILSTGIPSMPYLAAAMKAPILPLHFLAAVNTEKEVQTIMDYSTQHGLSCYATLGYDLSVTPAVAWINLLDLPDAYRQFLIRHHVQRVILAGQSPSPGGETEARQVLNGCNGLYQEGSIYLLYPGNTSDDGSTLAARIVDLNQINLSPNLMQITDWESGITPGQISNFGKSVHASTGLDFWVLTSTDLLSLYDLATYCYIGLFQRNNWSVNGIAMNPYLLGHPGYEAWKGFIPLVYWQGNSTNSTLARLTGTAEQGIVHAFPGVSLQHLVVWVNSARNFGGADSAASLVAGLESRGLALIRVNDYELDEIWEPSPEMNSICETVAVDLTAGSALTTYRNWYSSWQPLDIQGLTAVMANLPSVTLTYQ